MEEFQEARGRCWEEGIEIDDEGDPSQVTPGQGRQVHGCMQWGREWGAAMVAIEARGMNPPNICPLCHHYPQGGLGLLLGS